MRCRGDVSRGNLLASCLGAIIGIAIVACKPVPPPALSGQINLEYLGMSTSDISFRLSNGSNKTISVRGGRTVFSGIRIWAGDSSIECEAVPSKGSEEDPIGLGTGNPIVFSISSGEQARLTIPTTLPQRYKGGRCRLRLVLKGGTLVGPSEFQP